MTFNDNDIQGPVHGLKSLTFSDFEVVSLTPVVTGLSENGGQAGTTVTITGQNFSGAAGRLQVLFGNTPATNVTVLDDGQVTAVAPAGTGTVDVRVQSGVADPGDASNINSPIFGYGVSATTPADQFTYGSPQTMVTGVSPAAGPPEGGTTVTITGANLSAPRRSSSARSRRPASRSTRRRPSPPSARPAPGAVDVTVTTSFGVSATSSADRFTFASTPSGPIATDTPLFQWPAATGAVSYQLDIVDNTTGQNPLLQITNLSEAFYQLTAGQALSPGHAFTWYDGVIGANGAVAWSSGTTFSIAALTAPTPARPSGTIAAANGYDFPTFTWSLVAGANHYYLYVADAITGAAVIANPGVPGTSYTSSTALTPGHGYTWYVGAESANSNAVFWSGPARFALAPLAAPTQIAPRGTIAASSGYDTPTFSWSSVTGANHYYLYVLDNNTNQAVVNNPNVAGTSFTASAGLTSGHNFSWYVASISANGGAIVFGGPTGFALASLAAPAQIGPVGGTIAAGANFDTPTFRWNSVTGANHYYLYVLDNNTNQPVVNSANVAGASFTSTSGLTPGHSFSWYVGAEGVNGAAVFWSGPKSFALAALTAPIQIGPSGTVSAGSITTTPTFSWSSVAGASHYYLYLLDASTNQVLINNASITTISFTVGPALTVGHRYTWYVAAESTNGADLAWSGPDGFTLGP